MTEENEMNLKLMAAVLTMVLSESAMAIAGTSLPAGSYDHPASRLSKPQRGSSQGDFPTAPAGTYRADAMPLDEAQGGDARLSANLTEQEIECLAWGACKPRESA
jgi:hypothetical protein